MSQKANDRTPVAQDVFTWCTKEKTETWHVVRNHDAKGIVERVVCKACGSEHKYKRKTAAAAKPSPTRAIVRGNGGAIRNTGAASSGKMQVASAALDETWFAGVKKWGEKPVRAFDPSLFFKMGEVLDHASFGKGVVQLRRENRIDVLFKEGIKTLPSRPANTTV